MNANHRVDGVSFLRWIARIGAAVAVLFWGAFFVEHLNEWVFRATGSPPAEAWLGLFLHAVLLVGLLLGWRWERGGGAVSVVATVLFLAGRTKSDAAPWLLLGTLVPGCIWLLVGGCEWGRRNPSRSSTSNGREA